MLDFEQHYIQWKNQRIHHWPKKADFIPIENAFKPTEHELDQLRQHCQKSNFALYETNPETTSKEAIRALVKFLHMRDLDQNLCADNDAISTLETMDLGRAGGYIPYTNKALNWHTDGYYNQYNQHIRSFLLHCAQSAARGGENALINHELLYIYLYDQNPDYIKALMQADAMTIPANVENGIEIRPAQSGPVFYRDKQTNQLQMRYTARTRSILWKKDVTLGKALACIEEYLQANNEFVLRLTLQPGQGLICNNILHSRTAFEDKPSTNGQWPPSKRVLYRARSYNRLFTGL
jgi:hypothetical protein